MAWHTIGGGCSHGRENGLQDNAPLDEQNIDQETILAWIEAHWNDLAAFAWRNYVERGRGILLLHGDWAGDVSAGYQTPTMADEAGQPWPQELRDAANDYDPTVDIVFLVARGKSGILLGMTTTAGRQPPNLAGLEDDDPPLVPAA